ncbi:MAG TPA: hypothetical protein PKV93_13530 [Fervidobacterium sp.]|nr:hypothetical protein [Fervidobacterium sp.]
MRDEIRRILAEKITTVNSRIYEPYVPSLHIEKPYLVVKEGTKEAPNDWAGYTTTIEVWIFENFETFSDVDQLADEVISALDRQIITVNDKKYLLRYLATIGEDFWDEELQALERGLQFQVFSLGWLNSATYEPDPVMALKTWSERRWVKIETKDGKTIETPILQTDPDTWDPSDQRPGLYWRIAGISAPYNVSASMFWLNFDIYGHVVAPDPSVRREWARKITEALANVMRIPIDGETELCIDALAVTMDADPLAVGQIRLTGVMGLMRDKSTAEVLNQATVNGGVSFTIGATQMQPEEEV